MPDDDIIERRSEWKFLITDEGWHWTVTHPEGPEERSGHPFTTLSECAREAAEHGYGTWRAAERRHVEIGRLSGI
jgi:hypothetical protein